MRRSRSSSLLWILVVGCGVPAAPKARSCPPSTTGPVTLAGQDDVAALAGCHDVAGLVIRTGAPLDLAPLAELATIRGDVVVGPSVGLTELALPNVTAIDGALRAASNQDLRRILLPKLERAGRIDIASNLVLQTIVWAHLTTVPGSLAVTANPALEMIDMPALATAGELTIADNPELALVETPPEILERLGQALRQAEPRK
jgi:hypothetical protein